MSRFTKFRRLREIGIILAKYGIASFLPKPILTVFGLKKVDDDGKGFKDLTIEEKMRSAFEDLGPTFIKLGQILSIRNLKSKHGL